MSLKRTPLFETHCAAGAKMVDFGGWEMPLHYGSQIEEHLAVRSDCGMFDVSHMRVLDLQGPASLAFLQRLLANDAGKLVAGKALYSCMLRSDGGVIDDLIVYRMPDTAPVPYRIVVNAGTADGDVAWMRQVLAEAAFDARIAERTDLALVAVQGPHAQDRLGRAVPKLVPMLERLRAFTAEPAGEWFVARTGYTGEDGFEIALPAQQAADLWQALAAAGVRPCGLGARDTLRLEAGMNLYGNDMDATVTPLESGLAWTVDLRGDRAFVGREALERQAAAGGLRQLLGLKLEGRGVLRSHQAVETARGAGEVTSGTFSPSLGYSIAFARLPAGVQPGDRVTVALRGGPTGAVVCRLPFVRNGKAL